MGPFLTRKYFDGFSRFLNLNVHIANLEKILGPFLEQFLGPLMGPLLAPLLEPPLGHLLGPLLGPLPGTPSAVSCFFGTHNLDSFRLLAAADSPIIL